MAAKSEVIFIFIFRLNRADVEFDALLLQKKNTIKADSEILLMTIDRKFIN